MTTLTRGAWAEAGTSLAFHTGNWRSTAHPAHVHAKAPCHAACPAREDQQAWFAHLQEGHAEAAWRTLVTANPLPAITGRVCPHPCESACNRRELDGALTIHSVERWLGDEAIRKGWAYPLNPANGGGAAATANPQARVAIVGAGPAGLSAAWQCLRRGIGVELFDTLPEAGGLLRSAIPPTRLPRDVLQSEIERLLGLPGLTFNARQRLGRDLSLDELRQDYTAVLLAPGCQAGRHWDVAGAVPDDLHEGLQLLREFMDHGALPAAQSVVVHGGGNTAVDLCRILKRSGVGTVTLVTASALPGPGVDPADTINVVPRELKEALEEGIEIIEHATVNRLILRGSKVTGVEIVSLRKIPDAEGRSRRVSFEGTERVLAADMVVPAIGEQVDGDGLTGVLHGAYLAPAETWGRLPDESHVYVAGDARGDSGTVAKAIGDASLAVEAIAARLAGAEPAVDTREVLHVDGLNTVWYDHAAPATVASLPVADRGFETEIESGLSAGEVMREADRCLSCGNCLACDNCWTLCPDNAVIKLVELASDGSHYVFDMDYCKGCGLCAQECPTGYIRMAAGA